MQSEVTSIKNRDVQSPGIDSHIGCFFAVLSLLEVTIFQFNSTRLEVLLNDRDDGCIHGIRNCNKFFCIGKHVSSLLKLSHFAPCSLLKS